MRGGLRIAGFLLLFLVPLGADEPVELTISPSVARAPAVVDIRATIDPSQDYRTMTFVAESTDFYRSSQIDLGESSPVNWSVRYRDLPKGMYTVSVIVELADGNTRSVAKRVRVF